ncbi:alpha/beta hydrolase [Dyella sp. 333MFSha]|uniref:alpha/beta fold hydrolase n=1 Tax=Dyella sp. 333MFSha TaxID=1798240 RepID=UPI000884F43C|nr:alpha/beta hydrolase [Dyella sp. 333MFSha]SDF51761.1 Pimeloyl-ACP methyl ester carboxylesterase [Dyella sp. 333MFSha]
MCLSRFYRAFGAMLIVFAMLAGSPAAHAENKAYTVTASDGVVLAVQETGDPAGPPVILIHGLLGSRLNWEKQLQDPRLRHYRLITYDLRGHGLSGKPTDPDAYRDGRRWADDLAAVIETTGAHKPVLVGWSLGGAVISNYLATHGDGDVAGAVYVDGVIELKPDQITAHPEVYRDMTSTALKNHLDGERAFLRLCFHDEPDATTFSRLLANAALASWEMQRAVPSMTVDAAEGLSKAKIPLLLIYGEHDALVMPGPSIARAKAINPRIQSKLYAASGHAPFLEEPERFNRDLAAFVRAVTLPRAQTQGDN